MQEEQKTDELVTEVTSIAKEEAKTGQKIPVPNAEQLVANASIQLIQNRRMFVNLISQMSKKATIRTLSAVFDLPTSEIPVKLATEEEKLAFGLGQRIQMDRFILIQDAINKEMQKIKEEKSKVTEETTTSSEGEQK